MVDETLILRKLSELDEYYKQIREYDKVDAEIVVGILKKDLNNFVGYKNAIISFIKSESEQ
ncbi:MAG: hypothetical protein KJP23_07060 [Deltaproteobacteria bacterium]|nr:hypothetical protein [Deltaproteobacteria bacterium]